MARGYVELGVVAACGILASFARVLVIESFGVSSLSVLSIFWETRGSYVC